MGPVTYALSIHHFISSVGADAGFASIIGLAILVLLYFAQARETASLRDQAELAAQRIAQLESRLAHAITAQSQSGPAVVAPPPSVAIAGQHPVPAIAAMGAPSPPAGVAAPSLSAATKLIPTPPVQPPAIGAPGIAAARIGAARSSIVAGPAVHAANPPSALQPPAPPPVRGIVTPRPATAAGGAGTPTNGTGEHPAVLPPPLVPPLPPRPPVPAARPVLLDDFDDGGHERNDLTRILTAVAAVAVLAAIVIVLISLTSGSSPSHSSSNASGPVSNAPKPHHHAATPKTTTTVSDASITVSVLNGTPVYHLADDIATQLGADGFKEGTVTNAATQTQPTTTVEYVPGDQQDAAAVQKALKLSPSSVQPITSDTQALGCPQAGSCTVVVTVGADLSNSQTQTTP